MPSRSNLTKVKEWLDRLDRFEQAGQTITQFCQDEGVSPSTFFQWRKKLKSAGNRTGGNAFQPVQLTPPMPLPQVATIRLEEGIEIELGNDPCVAGAIVEVVVKQILGRQARRSEILPC